MHVNINVLASHAGTILKDSLNVGRIVRVIQLEFHQRLSLLRVQTEGWRRNQCWRAPRYIDNDTVGELQLFRTSRSI